MKYLLTLCTLFAWTIAGFGQSEMIKDLTKKTCDCLGGVRSLPAVETQLDSCVSKALLLAVQEGNKRAERYMNDGEGVRAVYQEIANALPGYCPRVRQLMLREKKKQYYTLSESESVNSLFEFGNDMMEEGNYREAIQTYQKATEQDPNFVFALDNTALAYRQLEQYERALDFYRQSLRIFPEGNLALKGIATTHMLMGQMDQAREYFRRLDFLYPDNPEGPFGLARVATRQGNYAEALDHIFTAQKLFQAQGAEEAREAEQLIGILYDRLDQEGRLDLFRQKAKEYGVQLEGMD